MNPMSSRSAHPVLPLCILAIAGAAFGLPMEAAAQTADNARARDSAPGIEFTIGGVMAFHADHEYCPLDDVVDALQGSLKYNLAGSGPLSAVSVEVTSALDGMFPWPWAANLSVPLDHNGGVRVTANLFVDLFEQGPLGFDLVAGAGVRRYGEGDGDAEFLEPISPSEVYRIESQVHPILLYGVLAELAVTDRVSLQGNVRGNTTFSGDLAVLDPNGASMTIDAGTQSFVQVTVGVGLKLGS